MTAAPSHLPDPTAAPDLATSIFAGLSKYPDLVQFDLGRYLLGAGLVFLIINKLLASALRNRKIRSESAVWSQMRREILTSLRTVLIFASTGIFVVTFILMGWAKLYDDPAQMGWGYFAFSVVAIIILHDAWFYWTHRLIHDPRLFRRFHRTHHKSFNPTPWTAYSFDIGEAALNALFVPLVIMILPMSFLTMFIFSAHMVIRNAIGHSGYEIFPANKDGKPMFDWLTAVTHHDLHHAQAGYNYGLYFTWWDRWMRTEHPEYLAEFARVTRPRQAESGQTSNV